MIELRILGAYDLRTADGRALDEALRRSKRIALLAYIAAARPIGFHRRDKLAALFWPELDKERARGALRTTLSRLRDDLGDDVVESRGTEEVALRRDRLWCDVAALHQCLERDDALGAADLYRGTMLDGVHIPGTSEAFEQWISEERAAIRTGLLAAVATHVDRYAAVGEWAPSVALAQRACVIAPDDESAARRLIRVALGSGDRGAALRAYEEIERVLQREYDVAPSEETKALVAPLRGAGELHSNGAKAISSGSANGATGVRHDARGGEPIARARLRQPLLIALLLLVTVAATWQLARRTAGNEADALPSGSWREIVVSAGVPPTRLHGRVTIDSGGNGMLVIGGVTLVPGGQTLLPTAGELWRLVGLKPGAGSQWARVPIAPGPAPRPRWQFGAAYDNSTDRWVVQGGALGRSSPCASDTWVLDRASGMSGQPAWREVRTRGPVPQARAGIEASLDVHRRKLIIFGGNDCINFYFHDTWVLTFDDSTFSTGTWARVLADSSEGQPVTRNGYAAVYDSAAARLFVYGGSTPQGTVAELWILDHADGTSGTPRWHALNCAGDAPPLHTPSSAYDAARDEWIFYGGADRVGAIRRELWRVEGLMRSPRSCRWTRATFTEPWPLPRSSGAAAVLPGNRGFLISTGYVAQFSLSDTWIFADTARR